MLVVVRSRIVEFPCWLNGSHTRRSAQPLGRHQNNKFRYDRLAEATPHGCYIDATRALPSERPRAIRACLPAIRSDLDISAIRNASSRAWLALSRGSTAVWYRSGSDSSVIDWAPPVHSVTSSPV